MKKLNYLTIFLIVLLFSNCDTDTTLENCRNNFSLPEPQEVYIFPHDTTVDMTELNCGYENIDYWGDALKRFVRKHTSELSRQRETSLGLIFHETYLPVQVVRHAKTEMLNGIVAKMKPFLRVSPFVHHVYVVNSYSPNAFTIAGGNIYVTTGLLEAMPSEAELAYVIGHEIGHTENNHTREAARYFNYAMELQEKIEAGDKGITLAVEAIGGVAALKLGMVVSRYLDRSDEFEADATGMLLAYLAGYDPEKAILAAKKLADWEGPPPEGWFARTIEDLGRSHPWSVERLDCLRGTLGRSKKNVACGMVFAPGTDGKVTTRKDPLTIRNIPSQMGVKVGAADKDEIVTLGCACSESDRINGKKGRWIYVITDDCEAGWAWGHYLQIQEGG